MNLKKSLLLIGVVLAGALLLLYSPYDHKYDTGSHPARISPTQAESSPKLALEPLVDTQGSVTVTITPTELSSNVSEWKFDVGLNTHTLELDQDITKVSVLVDDKGNEYKPIRWEGSVSGGHHREGILVFKAISPMPKSVELKIVNVGALIRSFVWNITS